MELVTACTLDCPDRCSLVCRQAPEGVHLTGAPSHPYTRGFTCDKIRRYPGRLASPHRIREPWMRRGDRFVAASWDEALEAVCGALAQARREDPASIFWLRGSGSMGASKGLVDYVFGLLGARGTAGSLCDSAGLAALAADTGGAQMNDPAQLDAAEAVVLWGKNPRASSIHCAAQVAAARKRGAPVVAVNPDTSGVSSLADRVVSVRPGTDRFLALAAAKLLLEGPGRPPPWDAASNRAEFETLLNTWPLSDLLAASGTDRADADALAAVYAATPRVATVVGWGLQRYPFGAENLRAVHALAFLAGSLGVPGGGLYYSVPSSRYLRRPPSPLRPTVPLRLPRLSQDLREASPQLQVAWVCCSNILNQAPDAKALREAFSTIPMVVAVEPFWTETARHATVVLPPALWLEEEDLAASYWHRGIGAVRRAVAPPEGCRTDFEIAADIARRLGIEVPFATVDDWLAACLPAGAPDLAEMRTRGWWLCDEPPVAWSAGFGHPGGRFRLLTAVSPEPAADPRHPLRFLTLIRPDALHSQLLPEEQKGALPARIHPDTAAALGLEPGCAIRLVSTTGEVEAEVHLDAGLHPGTVASPRGGWIGLGLGVNEATEALVTDLGEGAAYYGTRVRVEKMSRC
ncbi:MAG: molybdopterin-dependent oxidoreductase [Deltaproteobacteria bacterium]|nr:molybdopterin-dependent oxidoreductase [Deltaproteobacteria bacterium]